MPSKISQLRAVDAEIVQHVIARGKLWEKRNKIVKMLEDDPDLITYQAELIEWLERVNTTDSKGEATK